MIWVHKFKIIDFMQEFFIVSNAKWYFNSSSLKHMTWDNTLFSSFSPKKWGFVSYGYNNKRKIIVIGTISKFPNLMIVEFLLVGGLNPNLLSITQLCDKGDNITFDSSGCKVIKTKYDQTIFTGSRSESTYIVNLIKISSEDFVFLVTRIESCLWHKKITYIKMDHSNKLVRKDLVIGLHNIRFEKSRLCNVYQKGKQVRSYFKLNNFISNNQHLQLLHINLFGQFKTKTLGNNLYVCVIIDDLSFYIWTLFIV